jgi:hypothetical protein
MEIFGGRFLLIYFVLMFTGLAFAAFGYQFNVSGFVIAGIIWILVTPYSVRSHVPAQIRKWSVIFLLIGATAGIIVAMIFGESVKSIVGLIGGIVIGGAGGWVLYGIVFEALHILLDVILPKVSNFLVLVVLFLGALWGAINLSSSIPQYFGVIGGGLLVGGILGVFLGIVAGAKALEMDTQG